MCKNNIRDSRFLKVSRLYQYCPVLLGKEVDEIVNNEVSPGSYDYKFIGSELSSGVYLYRLVVDNNMIDTKKMVLLK